MWSHPTESQWALGLSIGIESIRPGVERHYTES